MRDKQRRKKGSRKRRRLESVVRQMKPANYRRHGALLHEPAVGKEFW